MRKTTFFLLAFVLIAALTACSSPVRGSGKAQTDERPVRGIRAVELATIGTLVIQQGDSESLTIEADDNILPLITSTVIDSTLRIDTRANSSFTPVVPILYTLTVSELNAITLSGSGSLTADSLIADTLTIELTGSGTMTLGAMMVTSGADISSGGSGNIAIRSLESGDTRLTMSGAGGVTIDALITSALEAELTDSGSAQISGTANTQNITVGGSGDYRAENLFSTSATASISSAGNIFINASDTLDAAVTGSGSITYMGDPALTPSDSGSGEIKPQS